METHPKPTSLFLNYFKKETLTLNTAVAAATITLMWSRVVAPTTAVASLLNDSLCSLSTQLQLRQRHYRVSFLFLSICVFFFMDFLISSVCLLGKRRKVRSVLWGSWVVLIWFSFKSYGIYGFFMLFGSVVCLALILELYSAAYNSAVMYKILNCNIAFSCSDVSILNEMINVILIYMYKRKHNLLENKKIHMICIS